MHDGHAVTVAEGGAGDQVDVHPVLAGLGLGHPLEVEPPGGAGTA